MEDIGARRIEAVRVEEGLLRAVDAEPESAASRSEDGPTPVETLFLGLPLLTGDEAAHEPHVGFVAETWPGAVTLLSSGADAGYALALKQPRPMIAGTTLSPLARAEPGLWDRGPALRVELARGTLASVGVEAVLSGAGAAAIGDGSPDRWELFQFAEAELLAPDTWDLRLRLRGQAETDGVMPDLWPAGSRFVLLDGAVAQWGYPASLRDRLRHYRWGPSEEAPGDPSWQHREAAFRGIGLRPYAVCHLRARAGSAGLALSWVRRTRVDGDSWTGTDVPLGEERESYLVRVTRGAAVLREVEVGAPAWTYAVAMQAEDRPGPVEIAVAQLSDRFGPEPFRALSATI